MEQPKIDYKIQDKMVEEAIAQEIYLQVGFKTAVCVLILNTSFEAVGSHSVVDVKDLDIAEGKAAARIVAFSKAKKHLEGIAMWRKAVADFQEAERNAAEARAQEQENRDLGQVEKPVRKLRNAAAKRGGK